MFKLFTTFAPLKKIAYILFIAVFVLSSACNTTEKVLKSSDTNYKYTKAMEWYNKKQYYKAIPVFEELMGLYKGEKSTEEIYFHYCMAQYKMKSHLLAAFHFKNFVSKHPYSKYAEQALFMHAESYNKQTLEYVLDQTETHNAIEAYQTFINTYPKSSYVAECNEKIDILRNKLETKAIKAADLYYKTQNYRAAAVSFRNLLLDYPDIDGVESIQYKIVKSYLLYADQSISKKQRERYNDCIKAAHNFENRYPNSAFLSAVHKIKEEAFFKTIKATYNNALSTPNFAKRKEILSEMPFVYQQNRPKINNIKWQGQAAKYLEKAYFQQVRTAYLQAQNATEKQERANYYQQVVEAYNIFSTKYGSSKMQNEAKRMFSVSEKNYKKYTNG